MWQPVFPFAPNTPLKDITSEGNQRAACKYYINLVQIIEHGSGGSRTAGR